MHVRNRVSQGKPLNYHHHHHINRFAIGIAVGLPPARASPVVSPFSSDQGQSGGWEGAAIKVSWRSVSVSVFGCMRLRTNEVTAVNDMIRRRARAATSHNWTSWLRSHPSCVPLSFSHGSLVKTSSPKSKCHREQRVLAK